MARPRARVPLNVYLNGRLVGQLRRHASGAVDFRYHPDWLGWEHALPVSLSLPLREDRYTGDSVIAVLDNLLPDSDAVRRRVAERIRAEGADAYSLLSKLGRDCVGALQFLPDGAAPGPPGIVEGRPVDDGYIARKVAELGETPLGLNEDEEFRVSLAGVQEKTALLLWRGKWHVPRGATATTHIIKPSIGVLASGIDLGQSVENEYLCLRLTSAFGVPTANATIEEFEGNHVLVVERFDRLWTRNGRLLRLPQEDCCQALSVPPSLKYESDGGPGITALLELLKASDDPQTDRRLFLKAQILFWLLGATDGHAKNFSIFLRPGGRFRLAPLYDVVSAQPALDAGQLRRNKMKLALAVGDNRHYAVHEVLPRHFLQTAARAGVPATTAQSVFEELVEAGEGAIARALEDLPPGFPEPLAERIVGGLRARLRKVEGAIERGGGGVRASAP